MLTSFALLLGGILLSSLFFAYLLAKKDILVVLVVSSALYLVGYLLISALLIFFGLFGVYRALVLTDVLFFLLAVISFMKFGRRLPAQVDFNIRPHILFLALLLVLVPFMSTRSQTISPSGDTGVYDLRAKAFLRGEGTAQSSYQEYEVDDPVIRDAFYDLAADQVGLYLRRDLSDDTHLYYEYHALPTWPALIALGYTIMGTQSPYDMVTVVFLLSILLLYLLLYEFCSKKINRYFAFSIFAFLPVTLFLGKTRFSELCFVMLFLLGCYLLQQKKPILKLLAGIAFGTIPFVHFSFFLYAPFLGAFLLYLCLSQRRRIYGFVNLIMLTMGLVSYPYAYSVSTLYTSFQIIGEFGLTAEQGMVVLTVAYLLGIACQCAALFILHRKPEGTFAPVAFFHRHKMNLLRGIVIFLALFTVYAAYSLAFTDKYGYGVGSWSLRSSYSNSGWPALAHLNLISIVMGTGYLALPIIAALIFFRKKDRWNDIDVLLAYAVFYVIAIYTIIRPDTPRNYYCSRYFFVVLFPLIVILLARLIQSKRMFFIISAVALCTALPFNVLIRQTTSDDGKFLLYNEVSNQTADDGIVLLETSDKTVLRTLFQNLRLMDGQLIYPFSIKDEIIARYKDTDIPITVISYNELDDEDLVLYMHNTYLMGGEYASLDGLYPTEYSMDEHAVYLYKYARDYTSLNFGEDLISLFENFYVLDRRGDIPFAWSKDSATFRLRFTPAAQNIVNISYLSMSTGIVEQNGPVKVTLYVDGNYAGETQIDESGCQGGALSFEVDGALFDEGKAHAITFTTDIWYPNEVIPDNLDTRPLGLPITGIEVMDAESAPQVKPEA